LKNTRDSPCPALHRNNTKKTLTPPGAPRFFLSSSLFFPSLSHFLVFSFSFFKVLLFISFLPFSSRLLVFSLPLWFYFCWLSTCTSDCSPPLAMDSHGNLTAKLAHPRGPRHTATDSTTPRGTYFRFSQIFIFLSVCCLISFHLKHTNLKSKKTENFGPNRGYLHTRPHTTPPHTNRNHADTLFTPTATGPIFPTHRVQGGAKKDEPPHPATWSPLNVSYLKMT
jgi:hypothetical protein